MNRIKQFFTTDWKPKYICLGIAVIIWLTVHYGFLKQEDDTPQQYGDIILSAP